MFTILIFRTLVIEDHDSGDDDNNIVMHGKREIG
jgi:hypothetical protein